MRVSVIIPCYNVSGFVARAVKSVRCQTHPDLELIAVDDGSTDGTLDELYHLSGEAGTPLTIIRQENMGACAARNSGLTRSTGDFIQFLDADDVLLPDKITHQLDLARRAGGADLIIGSHATFDAQGSSLGRTIQRPHQRDVWLDLMAHGFGVTSALLFARTKLKEAGGWAEGLRSSQEYDLMFRLLKNDARVVYDPEVLTEIHQRTSGSISQTGVEHNWERFVDLRIRIIEHLRSTRPDPELEPYLQVLFDSIRTYYLHAPDRALAIYETHMPTGFIPGRSTATGAGYLLLHRLLGFRWANRLRRLLSHGLMVSMW
jgi:glycosyltransferase involved in cell wall biosynthesis